MIFRIFRAYMMTTAGYSGIMSALESFNNTSNILNPESRAKKVLEDTINGTVEGPAKITKEILNALNKK